VAAVFRNSDRVHVDFSPTTRKYHRYGVNLIGFAHGCDEKIPDLPLIMATERPRDWAETTTREFHVGHVHHSKRLSSRDIDSKMGVRVRTLQSLTPPDAWHYRCGFIGSTRAAEAFLWSRERGFVANFEAKAR
jgi:hypothetical protein